MNNIANRRNEHVVGCLENQQNTILRFADECFVYNCICKSDCCVCFEMLDFVASLRSVVGFALTFVPNNAASYEKQQI